MTISNFLLKSASYLLAALMLSSCTQNTVTVKDTVQQVFKRQQDATITEQELKDFPYAGIYVKQAKNKRAFLVLVDAKRNQYPNNRHAWQLKWFSAGSELVETEQGRIIKTVNFSNGNLLRSYAKEPDPLVLGLLNQSTPKQWQRFIDWQPGNYSHITLNSSFSIGEKQQIDINGKPVTAQHVIEHVEVPELNLDYQNQFWLDLATQDVIASIQRPAPLISEIAIQTVKPFAGV